MHNKSSLVSSYQATTCSLQTHTQTRLFRATTAYVLPALPTASHGVPTNQHPITCTLCSNKAYMCYGKYSSLIGTHTRHHYPANQPPPKVYIDKAAFVSCHFGGRPPTTSVAFTPALSDTTPTAHGSCRKCRAHSALTSTDPVCSGLVLCFNSSFHVFLPLSRSERHNRHTKISHPCFNSSRTLTQISQNYCINFQP